VPQDWQQSVERVRRNGSPGMASRWQKTHQLIDVFSTNRTDGRK
jgi:hypothetical protein